MGARNHAADNYTKTVSPTLKEDNQSSNCANYPQTSANQVSEAISRNSKKAPRMTLLLDELDDLMVDMAPARTVLPSSKSEADLLHIKKLEKTQAQLLDRQKLGKQPSPSKIASAKLAHEWDLLDAELEKMSKHVAPPGKVDQYGSKALSESTENNTLYQNSVLDDVGEPVPSIPPHLQANNWTADRRASVPSANLDSAVSRLGEILLSDRDIGIVSLDQEGPSNNSYAMRYIVEVAVSETAAYKVFTENVYDQLKRDQDLCKSDLAKLVEECKREKSSGYVLAKLFHILGRFFVFDQTIHRHQAAALRWQILAKRGSEMARSDASSTGNAQPKLVEPSTPYELKSILKASPSLSPVPLGDLKDTVRGNQQFNQSSRQAVTPSTPISAYMMSSPNLRGQQARPLSESSDMGMKLASAEGRIRELEQMVAAQSSTIIELTNAQASKEEDLNFALKNVSTVKDALEQEQAAHEETQRKARDLSEELQDAQGELEVSRKKLEAHVESSKASVSTSQHEAELKAIKRQYVKESEALEETHKLRERQLEKALNAEILSKKELEVTVERLNSEMEARSRSEEKQALEMRQLQQKLEEEKKAEIEKLLSKHSMDRESLAVLHREEALAESRKLELERNRRMGLQSELSALTTERDALKLENEKLNLQLQDYEKQLEKFGRLANENAALEKELQEVISLRDSAKRDYERRLQNLERDLQDAQQKSELLSSRNSKLEKEMQSYASANGGSQVKAEEHDRIVKQLAQSKQTHELLKEELERQNAREQQLHLELDGVLKEFDRLSRNAAESDDKAQTLLRKLRQNESRLKDLEAKLQESQLADISSKGDASSMRKEFRSMLQDVRQEYEKQLEQELDERSKLELELRSMKREKDMELYKKINVGVQTSTLYTANF